MKFRIWAAAALLLALVPAGYSESQDKAATLWNQWRGPNRDGHSPDTGLLKQWPAAGPDLDWKARGMGGGYSSISASEKRLFTLGDLSDGCYLLALSPTDGKVVWKTKIGTAGGHKNFPGPRGTPSTDGKVVVALGQEGDLVCVDESNGKERWRKNLQSGFGGRVMSQWRWSESPLIDGTTVACTPGSSQGTVVAFDKDSGRQLWISSGLKDMAAYSSLVAADIGGVRQYIVLTDKSVAGIGAKDGKVLWRADRVGETAVCPTPICSDGFVFVTSGYKAGCNGFAIASEGGGKFRANQAYAGKQMVNHHGGVILVGNHVYGVDDGGSLKCLEFKTGREVWASPRMGKGSLAYADGHLIYRSENQRAGTIVLVEATPDSYKENGKFNQPDLSGQATWPHPSISGGKLYIRDQDVLLCYNLKGK